MTTMGALPASTLAFDLYDSEFAVLRGIARLDAPKVSADGVQNLCGATKHARSRCTYLNEIVAE